jgi:protein-disulfide isomerase
MFQSILLTSAAVAVAGTMVWRQVSASQHRQRAVANDVVAFVDKWEDMLAGETGRGSANGHVTVVEFSDLECPFCRRFHVALQAARAKYGTKLSHVFIHYPLAYHRFARPAARAAECAAEQGAFHPFIDRVFEQQDSLGLKSWASYALDAGVVDTGRLARCAAETGPLLRVDRHVALGEKFAVKGTPTVIVNGWRLPGTPNDEQLARVIDDVLAGRKPKVGATSSSPASQ